MAVKMNVVMYSLITPACFHNMALLTRSVSSPCSSFPLAYQLSEQNGWVGVLEIVCIFVVRSARLNSNKIAREPCPSS